MAKTYSIKSFELGNMDNLVHVLWDYDSKKAAVFDPAWEPDVLLDFFKTEQLTLDKIIITHGHFDHINAIPDLLNFTNARVYVSEAEYQYPQIDVFPSAASFVQDGDEIKLGSTAIRALSTPGHSIGGVCYLLSNDVIMGDTIFIYGCGHCALPGANVEKLYHSLQYLKSIIPPETLVHTSHTYGITNTSTWQAQLDGNPFLHCDHLDDFIQYREHIHDQTRIYPMSPITKDELQSILN